MENDNNNADNNNSIQNNTIEEIPQPENACETLHEVIKSRRKNRSLLFHILYAIDALDYETSAQEVAIKLNEEYEVDMDVTGSIVTISSSIAEQRKSLDQHLLPHLHNWKFERIGKCTLLVLRYAIWEMLNTDTPHNIVLNEAVELAKCFSEKDAYKFVNGVLDKISTQEKEKQKETEESQEDEESDDLESNDS